MVKKDVQFWLRLTIVAAFALIVYFAPFVLISFCLALFLTLLLRPLVDLIMKGVKRMGWEKFPIDLAIIASFLVFIFVLVLISNRILVPFISEFQAFIAHLPEMVDRTTVYTYKLQSQWSEFIPAGVQAIIQDLAVKIGDYTVIFARQSLLALLSLTTTLLELIVVPIITFYMLKKGGTFKIIFAKLFPEMFQKHILKIIQEMDDILSAYIRGQLLLSCLMTGVVFLGMWALGIQYPLVIALLAGIVELVPIIGPILGSIPAILLGAMDSVALAVKVLIFYIVVQQIDGHLVMPKLLGNVIHIHPVVIIAGVLIGSAFYGVFGMMIAVPVLAVLKVALKHMWYYNEYKNFY